MTREDIDAIVATMEDYASPLAMLARTTARRYHGRYEIGAVVRDDGTFEGSYLLPLDEDPSNGAGTGESAEQMVTMPDEVLLVFDADARQTPAAIMADARAWAEVHRTMRRCRRCGCTDEAACPGGCYWVAPDLCSACVDGVDADRVERSAVG